MVKKRVSVLIYRTERKRIWLYVDKTSKLLSMTPFRYQRQIDSIFAPFQKTYRPDPP